MWGWRHVREMQERIQVELRGLEYESRGRNTEDTKRGGNNLNKEISVTRNVRVTTLPLNKQTCPWGKRDGSGMDVEVLLWRCRRSCPLREHKWLWYLWRRCGLEHEDIWYRYILFVHGIGGHVNRRWRPGCRIGFWLDRCRERNQKVLFSENLVNWSSEKSWVRCYTKYSLSFVRVFVGQGSLGCQV